MAVFTEDELEYLLGNRLLARIATNFFVAAKVRDVARTRRAAIVIDDVLPSWTPGVSRCADGPRRSRNRSPSYAFIPSG